MLGFLLLSFRLIFAIMAASETNVKSIFYSKRRDHPHVWHSGQAESPFGGGGTGASGPVGLQTARVTAGHRCASGRKRLGRRHRAELFIPAGREGLGHLHQRAEPQPLRPHRHPPGLRRLHHAPAAGHRLWRRPRAGRAGAGERERLLPERAGTGHRRAERKARRSGRI